MTAEEYFHNKLNVSTVTAVVCFGFTIILMRFDGVTERNAYVM